MRRSDFALKILETMSMNALAVQRWDQNVVPDGTRRTEVRIIVRGALILGLVGGGRDRSRNTGTEGFSKLQKLILK